jgi:hypothetical protein
MEWWNNGMKEVWLIGVKIRSSFVTGPGAGLWPILDTGLWMLDLRGISFSPIPVMSIEEGRSNEL